MRVLQYSLYCKLLYRRPLYKNWYIYPSIYMLLPDLHRAKKKISSTKRLCIPLPRVLDFHIFFHIDFENSTPLFEIRQTIRSCQSWSLFFLRAFFPHVQIMFWHSPYFLHQLFFLYLQSLYLSTYIIY